MSERQCPVDFITTYISYTLGQQAPSVFHVWVAISVIAAALRRQAFVDWGYITIFPNLYVILVSPTGIGTKTTALGLGRELIEETIHDLNLFQGKITPTRLISRLKASEAKSGEKVANLTASIDEFKVFTKGVIHDSSLIVDLSTLFDCKKFEYDSELGLRATIDKPCVNLMAGSTPEWLSGGDTGDILTGGLGARIVPVCVLRDERVIAWPTLTEREIELKRRLIEDLNEIGKLGGSYFIDVEAKEFFVKWYETRGMNEYEDIRLSGWYNKKHTTLLKVAMCFAAAQGDDMMIHLDHIKAALRELTRLESTMMFAFSGATYGAKAQWQDQILTKIRLEGSMGHAELVRHFHYKMGTKEVRDVVNTLVDEERIERVQVTNEATRKVKMVYKYCGEGADVKKESNESNS